MSPRLAALALAAVLAAVVLGVGASGDGYLETVAALTLVNVALAVSLTVTNGFTGLFSLGHPAFMTLGAYVAVAFTYPSGRRGFAMPDLPEILVPVELPLWAAASLGALAAAAAALPIGAAALRLRTHYLAVATLGLVVVAESAALNLDGLTRGGRGLTGVPRLAELWFVALFAFAVVVLAWRLKRSSTGRAMLAVRENEMAARAFGIGAFRLKLLAFVLGAAVAGFAGALLPHVVAVMTPGSFGLSLAFTLVAITVVGGQGSVSGAVVAAVAVAAADELLRPVEEGLGLYGVTQALIAGALILVLLRRPKGLFGLGEVA